jgi:glycerate kinase
MEHIINIIEAQTNPVRDIPGAGAAGGLGAGLMAFLNARLASGINTVLDACFFENHIKDADLILTGEGKIDAQSAMGKTIDGVLSRAQKYGVPVIAIGGSIFDGAEVLHDKGLLGMFSICDRPQTLQSAMDNSAHLIEKLCSQIVRIFYIH